MIERGGVGVVLGGVLLAGLASSGAGAAEPFDRAERTLEVKLAELEFAAAVMENQPEAFASYLDPEAVFVGGAGVTRGRAAIVAAWKGFFAEGRPYFTWTPEVVELSADGELGLTRGPWTIRSTGAEGVKVEQSGLFNSVWRRRPDGAWRVVFDAGCPPCPACPGAAGAAAGVARAGSGSRAEKAREVLRLSGAATVGLTLMDQLLGTYRRLAPDVPEQFWSELSAELDAATLEELLVPIYERHFDDADLQGMIDFFSSPLGRKVVGEQPAIQQESFEVGQEWGRQMGQRIAQRLREKGYSLPD